MSVALAIAGCAALAGLLLGSFANVVIVRLPAEESVVSPGSRCPQCRGAIRWYDNVPLLSYMVLRGKCRECGTVIPWLYPVVELAMAAWFVLSFLPLATQLSIPLDSLLRLLISCAADAALGWFLLCLAVIDWRHHRLPNDLTYSGILCGLLFTCAEAIFLGDSEGDVVLKRRININSANAGRSTGNVFLTGPEHLIFGHLFAAVAAFLLLYLIRTAYRAVRKRNGMGLGDAKLLAMIAGFLGFAPTGVALFVGILVATVFGVGLLVRGRATPGTALPFGSFLALGGLAAALWGERIAAAYLTLFP